MMKQLLIDIQEQALVKEHSCQQEQSNPRVTPVSAQAYNLLGCCGIDGGLRNRVDSLREMERKHFPWRYEDTALKGCSLNAQGADSPMQLEYNEYPFRSWRNEVPQDAACSPSRSRRVL
jgi:hypothetical protein